MNDKHQPLNPKQGFTGNDLRPVLITGGAGFVGTNLADRLLDDGIPVLIFDNLGRPGVERNLEWLRSTHGNRVQVDIADTDAVVAAVRGDFTRSGAPCTGPGRYSTSPRRWRSPPASKIRPPISR